MKKYPREVTPFFWKECDKCRNQFKKEKMWFSVTPSYDHLLYGETKRYLCKECAPTMEIAEKYMNGGFMGEPPDCRPPKRPPEPIIRPINIIGV